MTKDWRWRKTQPMQGMTPAGRAVEIAQMIAQAYRDYRDPGTSDLDNDQPISLNVRILLGDARALDRDWPNER